MCDFQEELKNLESSLEKEQSYSKSLEVETNRLQEDKIAMEKDINRWCLQSSCGTT